MNNLKELHTAINHLYAIEKKSNPEYQCIVNEISELAEDLQRRKKEKVKITCAGIYNAGKSSLLNALTDGYNFKVGDIPTTATIDTYRTNKYQYVDTPGLNANKYDDKTAKEAFKDADMILFVSNMQNGGLNAAESEYLKQLANTLGGMDILEKQVVFVMSNLHQVEDDSVQKIITEHKKMIQLALGFEPKKICVYDAMTYQEGVKQNEQVLIDLSGIPALKAEIERHCQSLSSISEELYQQRITEKNKKLIADVNVFLEQYRADLLKLKARAASGSIDMNQLNAAKTKIKKIVQEFSPELPEYTGSSCKFWEFIRERYKNINDKSSEYAVKRELRDSLSTPYNNRESAARKCAQLDAEKIISYVRYESKVGNYYYDALAVVNKILAECNNEMLKINVRLPVNVIQEIATKPKATDLSESEIIRELCDGVVQYGSWYSIDEYIDMYIDIEEFDDFVGYSIFGNPKYRKKYRANNYNALDEMLNDCKVPYDNNVKSQFRQVQNIIRDFLERVTKELNDRIDIMLATADKIAEESNQNNETNRRADMLEEAIEAVQKNLK